MIIYIVVPGFSVRRGSSSFIAKTGWKVRTSIRTGLQDLDEHFRTEAERRTQIGTLMQKYKPVLLKREIPIDLHFEKCRCQFGDYCRHDGWLELRDALDVGEPLLLRDVSDWKFVTQEDVIAYEIQEKMKKGYSGYGSYRSEYRSWFPRMPLSDAAMHVEAVIMEPSSKAATKRARRAWMR